MTGDQKRDILDSVTDGYALTADGLDDALVGYVTIFHTTIALYDRAKCIEVLMRDGMTEEEADEYFCFNVQDAYVGAYTPGYATFFEEPVEPPLCRCGHPESAHRNGMNRQSCRQLLPHPPGMGVPQWCRCEHYVPDLPEASG